MPGKGLLNFNPERYEGDRLRGNLRSLASHVHDDHYVRGLSPSDLVPEPGGAAYAVVGAGRWLPLSLPDAVFLTSGIAHFDRPSEWVLGKLKFRLRYSSPVGSTSNFRVGIQSFAVKAGEVASTATVIVSATVTLPGPVVANTILTHEVYSTANVERDDELLSARVFRLGTNAADVNVNDFHVYGLRVEHISAVRESQ
jgi:hypothetical protein